MATICITGDPAVLESSASANYGDKAYFFVKGQTNIQAKPKQKLSLNIKLKLSENDDKETTFSFDTYYDKAIVGTNSFKITPKSPSTLYNSGETSKEYAIWRTSKANAVTDQKSTTGVRAIPNVKTFTFVGQTKDSTTQLLPTMQFTFLYCSQNSSSTFSIIVARSFISAEAWCT